MAQHLGNNIQHDPNRLNPAFGLNYNPAFFSVQNIYVSNKCVFFFFTLYSSQNFKAHSFHKNIKTTVFNTDN